MLKQKPKANHPRGAVVCLMCENYQYLSTVVWVRRLNSEDMVPIPSNNLHEAGCKPLRAIKVPSRKPKPVPERVCCRKHYYFIVDEG